MKKESLAARLDRPPADALRGHCIDVDQSKHNGPSFWVTNFESTIANYLRRQKVPAVSEICNHAIHAGPVTLEKSCEIHLRHAVLLLSSQAPHHDR
jgi:hypothetical protein